MTPKLLNCSPSSNFFSHLCVYICIAMGEEILYRTKLIPCLNKSILFNLHFLFNSLFLSSSLSVSFISVSISVSVSVCLSVCICLWLCVIVYSDTWFCHEACVEVRRQPWMLILDFYLAWSFLCVLYTVLSKILEILLCLLLIYKIKTTDVCLLLFRALHGF